MGYYIQTRDNLGKAKQIIAEHGAEAIPCPKNFSEVPADKALICVIQNGMFDAAGLCFDQREFSVFNQNCGRPKTWLLLDKQIAHTLSGFVE